MGGCKFDEDTVIYDMMCSDAEVMLMLIIEDIFILISRQASIDRFSIFQEKSPL